MSVFKVPDYPAKLTAQSWDKNKGTIAKMAGETGMGASLIKLRKTYDAIDWKVIQVDDRKPNPSKFKLPEWEKMCKDAAADGVKECEKLRKAAYETRDLAKDTAAKFKKNKLIPKESTKLCEEIETAADQLGVAANPNSVSGYISDAYKQGRAWLDLTAKLVTDGTLKKNVNTCLSAVDGLEKPEDWQKANIKDKTRHVTQILGNAVKVVNAGYPLGINATQCQQLFDRLALYADKSDQPFDDGDDNEFATHKKTLAALLKVAEKVG